jgi:hypothetical protein
MDKIKKFTRFNSIMPCWIAWTVSPQRREPRSFPLQRSDWRKGFFAPVALWIARHSTAEVALTRERGLPFGWLSGQDARDAGCPTAGNSRNRATIAQTAEAVRDFLYARMRGTQDTAKAVSAGRSAGSTSATGEYGELVKTLQAVAEELRSVRLALEKKEAVP